MTQRPSAIGDGPNRVSAIALRVLDALLLRNPERTAIGVTLGLAIQGVLGAFRPLLMVKGLDLGALDPVACISVGVVVVHLPLLIWSVQHRPLISDELESLIKLVESTNIGEAERRAAYREIVNKCIAEFSLSARPGLIKGIVRDEIRGRSLAE